MKRRTPSATPDTETEPQPQPGQDLAAARERAGISRDDMAVRLRLRQSQLDSLEQDDYAGLPPPTFVRGYLRAYARELGLEPEAFVTAYAARTASDDKPELLTRAGMEHSHTGGPGVWIGLLLIVLVVGGGAGAWWYQHRLIDRDGAAAEGAANATADAGSDASGDAETEVAGAGTASNEQAQNDQTLNDQTRDAASAATDGGSQEVTGDAATDEASPSAEQPSADTNAVTTDSQENEEGAASAAIDDGAQNESGGGSMGASGDNGTQTAANETTATSADAEADDSAGSQGADSSAAADGPARLVLAVDGRSWVEVRDAEGRKLAYTLYHDAAPLKLQGEPPFRIYLGNARVVQVSLNGESVDMQSFIQGNNTARVVVDQSGAHAR